MPANGPYLVALTLAAIALLLFLILAVRLHAFLALMISSMALGLAAEGRKVAVVTIDPAKRLASALGLRELSSEPRRIDPEVFVELAQRIVEAATLHVQRCEQCMDLQLRLSVPSVQLWPQLSFGSADLIVPPLERRRYCPQMRNQLRSLVAVDTAKRFIEDQERGEEGVALGEGVRREDQQRQEQRRHEHGRRAGAG